jgi:hypothetical protein
MRIRYALLIILAVAAAAAFAGQVDTGTKEQVVKLPFCGT